MIAAFAAATAAVAVSIVNAAEAAASSCVYDAGAQSMAVGMDPGGVTTLSVSGGDLLVDGAPCLGATTTNTDSIAVTGHVGSNERLVLDERGGVFGPGATPESNVPEIEMTAMLGDTTDTLVVYGTEGDDAMSSGESGFALFGDGDVDVVITPNAFSLEVHLLGGHDFFNGRGTFGAGLAFKGPIVATGGDGNDLLRGSNKVDVIDGGAGNDEIDGVWGDDQIDAGPGDDEVLGGSENDTIDLGPGADSVVAGSGDDVVHADDGEADLSLLGGGNADTLVYDCQADPAPTQFETLTCGDEPPPPPPSGGDCSYDPTSKTLTTTIPSGGLGRLSVSSGAIVFDNGTAQDCGGATLANVESIKVNGTVGTVERLTVDQSTGAFVGGAAEGTGVAEVEIVVALGDASDLVAVTGTPGDDTLAVGVKGVAVNSDSDVDVEISPLPAWVGISGDGGVDYLSGRGGFGAGSVFTGTLEAVLEGASGGTILGGAGNDALVGSGGADHIEGREGNDALHGLGGNDTLNGQGGNDTITGDGGADSMSGSDGDDVFHANDGEADTYINGGPGTDTANYDAAFDTSIVAVENRNGV
jgi:Ca2+-binding RTX toxin-like protein